MTSKCSFLIFLIFTTLGCSKKYSIVEYNLIPKAYSMSYNNGYFKLPEKVSLGFPVFFGKEAQLLKEWYTKDFNINIELDGGERTGDIILVLDKLFNPDNVEAYEVMVNTDEVKLIANSKTGITHAIQTLRQLITEQNDKYIIQRGIINDKPQLPWRAFMLDEGRYFRGKEVVKGILDEMSKLKLNIFHWHLISDEGWRFEIKRYPRLTETNIDTGQLPTDTAITKKAACEFYTQEDLVEIVQYASDRHIVIIPEFCIPGHMDKAIAAYPWLGTENQLTPPFEDYQKTHNLLDISDERVMLFVSDLLDELIAIFDAPIIHINGNGVNYEQWENSLNIQAYMKKKNLHSLNDLQLHFISEITDLLTEKGGYIMGGSEITSNVILKGLSNKDNDNPLIKDLEKDAIVHFCNNDSLLIKETAEQGYRVVGSNLSCNTKAYNNEYQSLEQAYAFNPIPSNLSPTLSEKVLGFSCQLYTDTSLTLAAINKTILPQLAAYAEVGWTPVDKREYSGFKMRLLQQLKRWSNNNEVKN